MRYLVVIEKAKSNYGAYSPDLPGCVATGDTVVHPIPYSFNVPPRKWSATLRAINDLGYTTLIPGHGEIQHDYSYVNLLIAASDSIADQRDALLASGLSEEDALEQLDYSEFEQSFTNGDPYITYYYNSWFTGPFSKASFKALKGIPMVEILPVDE